MTSTRVQTIPFATQDYTSVQYGDDRINMYVTEPVAGVRGTTGLMFIGHGWGTDGSVDYADESAQLADLFDLVVTRVEYRHSGREARHPLPERTFDVPYDLCKLQTVDCLRATYATLQRYPQLDRTRVIYWGASQGAFLGAQSLIFAPHLWAYAVLICGAYQPLSDADAQARGFSMDLRAAPGIGFAECALGKGQSFSPAEEDIRNPYRNAALLPAEVPIALLHGTNDELVDIRHSVMLYSRLQGLRRPVQFYPIENGDHWMKGATRPDEESAYLAVLKHCGDVSRTVHRPGATLLPTAPVRIPVRGGTFVVTYTAAGPTLVWQPGTGQ
jgi:predicted esterase